MDLKPTVRVFCELSEDYSLSIRNGKVVLALSNPNDPFQHWIKEELDGDRFTLFNKATAQAIKRSPDVSPVNERIIELLLISMPFGSDPDPDAVWIESKQGDGFATIFGGDRQGFRLQPDSCLTYDGNTLNLSNLDLGTYQRWKFVPYYEDGVVCPKTVKIYAREKLIYNLTVRDDTVVFARCDRTDPYQHWRIERAYCQHLKDDDGSPAFAIVNVATGKAIQHGTVANGYPVTLFPLIPTYMDESILWTEGKSMGDGFKKIKIRTNVGLMLDVLYDKEWFPAGAQEGMRMGLWRDGSNPSKQWKIEEFY